MQNTFIFQEIARFKTDELMEEASRDRLATLATGGRKISRGSSPVIRFLLSWTSAVSGDALSVREMKGEGSPR
jgi:hypothetical protein